MFGALRDFKTGTGGAYASLSGGQKPFPAARVARFVRMTERARIRTLDCVKVHILERTQIVRKPLAETFNFFVDPRNLKRLTPEYLGFKFLEPPPAQLQTGSAIDYQIQLYGVPIHWRTRIELLDAPKKFVDLQEKGPYALWRHRHTFRDAGHNRTEVKDFVEYALPLWPLGEVAYYVLVARSLAQIFDYRERELAAIIAADSRGTLSG